MEMSKNANHEITKKWLMLAVWMLALSGIFSLIIVFARTPGLYNLPYIKKLFHGALVIHVDLLVLAWPLCIAAMMWSAFCPSKLEVQNKEHLVVNYAGMISIGLGALFLVAAPLDFAAEPLKNNYIPVITSHIFILGLLLLGIGAAALAFHAVYLNKRNAMTDVSLSAILNWGARGAALIVLFSLVAIYIGFENTPKDVLEPEQYYEYAFWAGGHIYQYAFTQIMMLAWLWVSYCITKTELQSYQIVRAIMLLNTVIGCVGIYGILAYETTSFEYNQFYTNHMIIGGGLAPVIFLAWLAVIHKKWRKNRPESAAVPTYLYPALAISIALFLYGGFLGLLIQGQDVTIPAHYHGSTISVTIALMGFAYAYMPRLTENPLPIRLMKWQPIIYGGGQFLHITGLAISGGYGALRKTPGVEGTAGAKAAMGIMGLGGLLAVIGGLLFVYIMYVCLRSRSQKA